MPSLTLVAGTAVPHRERVTADMIAAVYAANRVRLINFIAVQVRSVEDAEDIAQSACAKLCSRQRGIVPDNICGLLFVAARNLAIDHNRRNRRQRGWQQDLDGDAVLISQVPHPQPAADRALMASEHLQIVRDLLEELPPKCRAAFVAYKFEERDYAAIAADLAVSESMVRKYVLKAMAHCARRFKEVEGWA